VTVPRPNGMTDAGGFWSLVAEGSLPYQRCAACGTVDCPPGSSCRACGAPVEGWLSSEGLGTVVTWTQIERTGDPAYQRELPYVVAIIELDEGFSMLAGIGPAASVDIGVRCRLGFRRSPATDSMAPHFEVVP
jgi:uncharacterized OB-fold protein